MTTPAAWVESVPTGGIPSARGRYRSRLARTCGFSVATSFFSSGLTASALLIVICSSFWRLRGEPRPTSLYGIVSALPTSRIAPRHAVPGCGDMTIYYRRSAVLFVDVAHHPPAEHANKKSTSISGMKRSSD